MKRRRGERGQKCDFLLGAQQAEAGAGVQVVEHDAAEEAPSRAPAEQQSRRAPSRAAEQKSRREPPAATNLKMKYASRPLLAEIKFTRCTHATIWKKGTR